MFGKLAGRVLAVAALLGSCAGAATVSWKLTRTEHFEIYSQVDENRTLHLLTWLEQLRAFFLDQSIVKLDHIPPVRLILFASSNDYQSFRVRALSDGHYAGSENRRYIAMYVGADERRIAAHELAHVALNSNGANFPPWLSEGLAEFFSTVRIDENGSEIGAEMPAHVQALARRSWIPLPDLQAMPDDSPLRADRDGAQMFYAESWALADMLVLSPEYAPRFPAMLGATREGAPAREAIESTYGKSTEEIERDLHAWTGKRMPKSIRSARAATPTFAANTSDLSDFAARSVLADMLAAAGELDRAEALLRDLARETPQDAQIAAALGAVALRKGDMGTARAEWKRAIGQGLTDAEICYRYALLADAAGLPADEMRVALERAVALRPDFDDARYKLALLHKNAGRYDSALEQLRAMQSVAPARAFNYWSALADSLNELGKRDDALDAARKAAQHATTADERTWAANLAYIAQTDLAVQLTRDSNGRAQMVTTRVPHQSAEDWNPFVEAGDDVRSVSGRLREIDCTTGVTHIRLELARAVLTLAIPDPARVRMRNAPEELVCGPQEDVTIEVQYAASKAGTVDGLIRGINFLRSE